MENLQSLFESLIPYISDLEAKERQKHLDRFQRRIEYIETLKLNQSPTFKIQIEERSLNSQVKNLDKTIYYWRLSIKFKLFTALSKYIQDSDVFTNTHFQQGRKGIEITTTVNRNGETYNLYTEAIPAGGYYVQCFHYRYITKTTLPATKVSKELLKAFRAQEEQEKIQYLKSIKS